MFGGLLSLYAVVFHDGCFGGLVDFEEVGDLGFAEAFGFEE